MIMIFGLLALGTVIKVFADAALVSSTDDWALSTTIAFDLLMDNFSILDLGILRSLWHVLKHLLSLLFKLFLDELFEDLLWHSMLFAFSWLLVIWLRIR
jgi:hypothetical protein